MFPLFGRKHKRQEGWGLVEVLPAKDTVSRLPPDYKAVPTRDIPTLVTAYVLAMESEESENWCRCEWLIHPDDTEVPKGCCRKCGGKKVERIHLDTIGGNHLFAGIRKRRGDQDSTCPVHTREGFLIYFFEWVYKNGN